MIKLDKKHSGVFAAGVLFGTDVYKRQSTGMEELINTDKIIRPAYKNVLPEAEYIPLSER